MKTRRDYKPRRAFLSAIPSDDAQKKKAKPPFTKLNSRKTPKRARQLFSRIFNEIYLISNPQIVSVRIQLTRAVYQSRKTPA